MSHALQIQITNRKIKKLTKEEMCIGLIQNHGVEPEDIMLIVTIAEGYATYNPETDEISLTSEGVSLGECLNMYMI